MKNNLGVILLIVVSSFILILFRMKSIEQDYAMNEIKKNMEESKVKYKELYSKKEKFLSIGNLRKLSKKFDFKEPTSDKIIVVPEK
jgi:hypothetical protein